MYRFFVVKWRIINSNGKDLIMNRTAPPSGISFSVNEADLTGISWDGTDSTIEYHVVSNGDHRLFQRLVENLICCTLQKKVSSLSFYFTTSHNSECEYNSQSKRLFAKQSYH